MRGVKQVLIVDDDESTRLLLRRILESIPDLRITLADGGADALRLVGQDTYDLILLDLLMPGIGGIQVLTRIRGSTPNKATPVIVVSVMADPDTQIVCQSLRISGYVVKPIQRDVLTRAVKDAMRLATA